MTSMMPAPATAAVAMQAPVTTGGGAVPAATGQPDLAAVLQQIVQLLSQLSGTMGASTGAGQLAATAAPVAGGGGAAASVAPGVTIGSTAAAPAAATLTGAATTMQSADHVPTLTTAALTTAQANGFTIAGGGGALAAPAAAPAAAAAAPAATATPTFDSRRLVGTPQAGGVIDVALRSMSASTAPAKSEGQFIVLTDGNGAQMQAHVHGAWSSHPTRIAEGIQRGFIAVHLHTDGTLHLHDVV